MSSDFNNMSPEELLEMQKKNCIFCKIISKEIPSYEIYSDDKAFVILDINPASEGHILILPKQHYQILPQLPDDLIKHLSLMAKRASKTLLKGLAAEGTTTFIANGAIAGQKAPHFMIHVIPRKNGDLLFQMPKHNADEKELEVMKNNLAARMAAMTGRKPPQKTVQLEHKPAEKKEAPKKETKIEESDEKEEELEKKDSIEESEDKKEVDLDKIAKLFG
jgi:histidine triad (HIT) family protein